jgi:hypothetical protein
VRCSSVEPRQFVNLAAGPEPNPRRAARTCCQRLGWRPGTVATRPAFYGVARSRSPPADFVAPGLRAHKPLALIRHRHLGAMALGPPVVSGSTGGDHASTTRCPARRPMRRLPGLGGGLGSDFIFVCSVIAAITGSLSHDNGEAARGIATGQHQPARHRGWRRKYFIWTRKPGAIRTTPMTPVGREICDACPREGDTLPSSSGMPILRCRLSGELTIGSVMWRPHVIRASEPFSRG